MNESSVLDVGQSVQNDYGILEPIENDNSQIENQETVADPNAENLEAEGSASVSQVYEVLNIPEYTVENPMPVILVEEQEEQTELEVFALTGKYNGTISDTYLDYFEGIVEKLRPNEHYVIWRSGQYAYTMCWGEEIELEGTYFSGTADSCVLFRSSDSYNADWFVDWGTDNLALSASDLFVYSDLGQFSTVERGMKHGESMALAFGLASAFVFVLAHSIFNYIVKYVYRK